MHGWGRIFGCSCLFEAGRRDRSALQHYSERLSSRILCLIGQERPFLHSSPKTSDQRVEMYLQANACFCNWSVICDHSNGFICSSPLPSSTPPECNPLLVSFFLLLLLQPLWFSETFEPQCRLMFCPHSFISLVTMRCSDRVIYFQLGFEGNF